MTTATVISRDRATLCAVGGRQVIFRGSVAGTQGRCAQYRSTGRIRMVHINIRT